MTVKEHYDTHLADFYSWMSGDFETRHKDFQRFLVDNGIIPSAATKAIDLGAGHGIQSVALAKLGFTVIAVDFNKHLLDELKVNAKGLPIELVLDDIRNVRQFADKDVELIICCGDTLTHLNNKGEVEGLIADISSILKPGGKAVLSFRDYSAALTADDRFIPVKSDETRILTCVLEFEEDSVRVTDLLNVRTVSGWTQKVSSYQKVRISPADIVRTLEIHGMSIQLNQIINRMTTIIAKRTSL
jgi:SAM-dependent methyltransferase